jgi:hypothetical protein
MRASCGNGSSSMLDLSCLLRLGRLSTNFATRSPKTRMSQLYTVINTVHHLRLTYIGVPTVLIEVGSLGLLTDPTFEAAGYEYLAGSQVICKTISPALSTSDLGPVDTVLFSHDQHSDNLSGSGRPCPAFPGQTHVDYSCGCRASGWERGGDWSLANRHPDRHTWDADAGNRHSNPSRSRRDRTCDLRSDWLAARMGKRTRPHALHLRRYRALPRAGRRRQTFPYQRRLAALRRSSGRTVRPGFHHAHGLRRSAHRCPARGCHYHSHTL